ncbi:MAG: ABC transporter substrate-binding protein [Thermotogae bacterium]|nr:ABC transporter substrate-binding protein [Thermotogota bacterium]
MKNLLKVSLILLLTLFIAVNLTATVTIEFWHAMGGGHGKALNEIITKFNQEHPDIQVKGVYVGNYSALNQKLLSAVQAGKPPAISQVYEDWTTKLIHADAIVPVEKFVNDPKIGLSKAELGDIIKVFYEDNVWDGKLYTLPFNKSTSLLFVNTDAFMIEGLDYPKTMDEFLKDAKILTQDWNGDGKIDQYGFGIRPTVDTFNIFLRSNGGKIITEKESKSIVTVNDEKGVEALQFMCDLVNKYKVAYMQGGYFSGPFGTGKVAMYIGSSAGKPYVDRACSGNHGWTWIYVPSWKMRAVPFMGTNLAIYKGVSEEQQIAAWKFLKYLISPDITTFWAIKTGYMPVRYSALKSTEWQEFVKSDPKNSVPVGQADKYGVLDPRPLMWNEIRTEVSNAVRDAMYGKKAPKRALDDAAKEIEKLLQEGR